ncbi:putative HTH-type transcriptional regulator YxaF [bacterium BMS3Abin03]|nr:putative HTH-type transcriptional regulator YxaF [bacterium BMS3Abin03]
MVDEKNLSRKERERIFRRKEIMDAAVRFFAQKGFSATTLDEIALASEFGKGTLYNYFSGKEEIYTAIVEEVSATLEEIVKSAIQETSTPIDFIELYTRKLFNYCLNNCFDFILYVREVAHFTTDIYITDRNMIVSRHERVKNLIVERLKEGMVSKTLKKADPEKLSTLYEHLVFPYILFLITAPQQKLDEDEEINLILSVFFNGIIQKTK